MLVFTVLGNFNRPVSLSAQNTQAERGRPLGSGQCFPSQIRSRLNRSAADNRVIPPPVAYRILRLVQIPFEHLQQIDDSLNRLIKVLAVGGLLQYAETDHVIERLHGHLGAHGKFLACMKEPGRVQIHLERSAAQYIDGFTQQHGNHHLELPYRLLAHHPLQRHIRSTSRLQPLEGVDRLVNSLLLRR